MGELAANYDVPAIEFDRAGYPELHCGYDDYTKALYKAVDSDFVASAAGTGNDPGH